MDFTSDTRSVAELISSIIGKVESDYYWEDGMLVTDWLRDDLNHLVKKALIEVSVDLTNLPEKHPDVTFYRTSSDELDELGDL